MLKTVQTARRETTSSRVGIAVCEHPDETWPGRAKLINESISTIIETLGMAGGLLQEDECMRELCKTIHLFACRAGAALNVRKESLADVLMSNEKGILWKGFLERADISEKDDNKDPLAEVLASIPINKEEIIFRVCSDNMSPTIRPGAVVGIDTSENERKTYVNGEIYLIGYSNPDIPPNLYRFMETGPHTVRLVSDNKQLYHSSWDCEGDEIMGQVTGRLRWIVQRFY